MAKPVLVEYNKKEKHVCKVSEETLKHDENYDDEIENVEAFIVTEYSKSKDKKGLFVAFRVEKDEKVRCDDGELTEAYDENDRLYVDDKSLNACGERHYFITGAGEKSTFIVKIAPNIDEKVFKAMWDDIKVICLELLYNPGTASKAKIPGDGYQIEVLKQKVTEVSRIIDALNKEPQRDYLVQEEIIPFRLVKRIDAKTVMDHYVLNKNRVRAKVHIESFDIYENRLIKAYLESLVSELRLLRNDKKVDMDDPESKDIINRDEELEKIEAQIQNLLNKKMFNEITQSNERLHSTNLFVNHPQYKKAYDMIKRNTPAEEIISMKCRYEDVRLSSGIYEIWCFLKILKMLVEEGFEIKEIQRPAGVKEEKKDDGKTTIKRGLNDNNLEDCNYNQLITLIREEIEEKSEIALYNLMLKLERDGESIFLAYNYTFLRKEGNQLFKEGKDYTKYTRSPDISLIKYVHGEKHTCIIDAKYHDYRTNEQGILEWKNDMMTCAVEKHIYDLSRAEEPFSKCGSGKAVPIYSCIVHPNLYDRNDNFYYKNDNFYVDNGQIASIRERLYVIYKDWETDYVHIHKHNLKKYKYNLVNLIKSKDGADYYKKLWSMAFLPDRYMIVKEVLERFINQ